MNSFGEILFLLLAGHALADYPLQGDFLARGKNRAFPVSNAPWYHWCHCLGAHALIHGGVVALITGNVWLGVAETICHAIIDDQKCVGRLSFNSDQALHVVCKLLWADITTGGVVSSFVKGVFG